MADRTPDLETLAQHGAHRPGRRLNRIETFVAGVVVGFGLGEMVAAVVMAWAR